MAKYVSLKKTTACCFQEIALRLSFNPFGNNFYVKCFSKCEDHVDNRASIGITWNPINKRLVNLDLIKRQTLKVG